MRTRRLLSRLLHSTQGGGLVEMALVLPVLLLLFGGVIDLGRAYYLAQEIAGAAESAAIYGVQNPTGTAGITAAAQAAAPDVPNLTVATPAYGCECSDGSSYSANCSSAPSCPANTSLVYRMSVSVSTTYSPWVPLPAVSSPMTITRSAEMRSSGS